MHMHDISPWQHSHDFATELDRRAERRTLWVVYLTLVTMLVELLAGWLTGSMALLADGWHMGSHAAALGLAAFAYGFARRHADDRRFTFGTGKASPLAGYTSALLLGLGALWLGGESIARLFDPVQIHYAEAIAVACLGLVVNLLSAWLLGHDHGHEHEHEHGHGHGHSTQNRHAHAHAHAHTLAARATGGESAHQDHNLRAAYLHVIADALTSMLAIVALAGGALLGWRFLDPFMGIIGALLIGSWALRLARDTAATLLDAEDTEHLEQQIRTTLESIDDTQVSDLHVWRVGNHSRACVVSLVTHHPRSPAFYRAHLADVPSIHHLNVEVQHCDDARCAIGP